MIVPLTAKQRVDVLREHGPGRVRVRQCLTCGHLELDSWNDPLVLAQKMLKGKKAHAYLKKYDPSQLRDEVVVVEGSDACEQCYEAAKSVNPTFVGWVQALVAHQIAVAQLIVSCNSSG
mgnify:CR=1 FL=1